MILQILLGPRAIPVAWGQSNRHHIIEADGRTICGKKIQKRARIGISQKECLNCKLHK